MHRLLQMFLLTLAAHGLAPEALDPWRGWMAFKEFARAVHETPDPGTSVQFTRTPEHGELRLVFLRQAASEDDGWLEPTGGVVCELTFPRAPCIRVEWDHWSFDHSSCDRFVDIVEQEQDFQDLMVARPIRSAVYWAEA